MDPWTWNSVLARSEVQVPSPYFIPLCFWASDEPQGPGGWAASIQRPPDLTSALRGTVHSSERGVKGAGQEYLTQGP